MQTRRARMFLSLALTALPGVAQQTIHFASVSGRVADPSGGVIENALVQARHTETNVSTATRTGPEGRFRFPYLRPGVYEFTFGKTGFAEQKRTVSLNAGGAYELPIALGLAATVSNMEVTAEASLLEASRSQIAVAAPQAEIARLPMNGRNFLDIALLVPGVSPTNIASTQLFPETSAVPGQGISINSQRNFSNSFIVDGLQANDDAAGLSGMPYSPDAISQFQVVTSGGQAEFGRALGGYVSVVTRSGASVLHGDLYGYFKDQRLNARNPLSHAKLPMTQMQYGASLGGPLVKDRTFYFGNFEQRRLNQSGLVTISPANVAAINSRLDAVGYQGPRVTTGLYPNPVDTTNVLGKVDHQVSSNQMLTLRYSLYDAGSIHSRGAGGLSAPSAASGLANRDHNIAVSSIVTISPRVVNELRGQFLHSDLNAEPMDATGPAVSIAGVASFGRLSSSPTGRRNRLYEIANNVSVQAGTHALRFGTGLLFNDSTITFPRATRGSYSFSSLASFLSGTYNNAGFTQTFGPSAVRQSNPNVSFYAQDEWKLHPRLTINAGLRYDLQFLETIRTDTNNISPRIGLSWAPFESRNTVIRGSYGLFYDRVPLRALANALLSSRNTTELTDESQVNVSLSPTQNGAPVFPNVLTSRPPAGLVNFSTMDRNMENAYAVQTSVEVEHRLGERSTVSVGYQRVRGLHLIVNLNRNVPACIAAGGNNGCRPNPNYANNNEYSAGADSRYDGMHISFVQRPARWSSYRLSYTYSKSMNNVGEFFFSSPIDMYNIWQDWARSDDDQRHRLVMNGAVHTSTSAPKNAWEWLSHGLELSGTLQYYSALPFHITTGSTTVQGTAARPVVNGSFLPRNAGEGFDRFHINFRVSRSITLGERLRLQILGEMFNVTNRVNGLTLNGTFGPGIYPHDPLPTFGQTTAVMEPRSGQLALRLTF